MARSASILVIPLLLLAAGMLAAEDKAPGYQDTPLIPGSSWHVHDDRRPQPVAVDPGTGYPADLPGRPPSDAVVLFGGEGTAEWTGPWQVFDRLLIASGGDLKTVREFGDIQLHLEYRQPEPPDADWTKRGNSGVFLMDRYEIQILDNFASLGYADGTCGAVYGQHPPLVNACRRAGQWQALDIVWVAPRFAEGRLAAPGYATVLHNGVLVQHHAEVLGSTAHRAAPAYAPHGPTGPIRLQFHGSPVAFRAIWVRELAPPAPRP